MDDIYTGTSDSDGGYGNDKLRESKGEIYKHVDAPKAEYTDVVRRVASKLSNFNWSGLDVYVSDVIVPFGRVGIIHCLKELEQHLKFVLHKKFVILCKHDDHIHVAHVCRQTNNSCRCAWLQRSAHFRKYRRKHVRRRVFAYNMSTTDWTDIIGYFCSNGHITKKVYIDCADAGLCGEIRNISVSIYIMYIIYMYANNSIFNSKNKI